MITQPSGLMSSSPYSTEFMASKTVGGPYSADTYMDNSGSWIVADDAYSSTGLMSTPSPDQSLSVFDSVMNMVDSAGSWMEKNKTFTNLAGGLAGGLMAWNESDIMQDQYNQAMQFRYDSMNMNSDQFERQLAINQQLADASSMNAETGRMRAEWAEDQRQQHNAGISSFGSKYGK